MGADYIVVEDLRKRYGAVNAVDGVSFAVNRGEVFGLLGPNGAGKTTTLEIMEGLRRPDAGRIKVAGIDVTAEHGHLKRVIGVQLQEAGFFERLTVEETIRLFASFHTRSVSIKELMRRFQLEDRATAMVEKLSGGQKQRLSLALALLNDPEVVFLDEPTTGLDPQARRHMWDAIKGIKGEGKTIILTTHYMEEAEQLCDRVAIMDRGKILDMDKPQVLIRRHASGGSITFLCEHGGGLNLEGLAGVHHVTSKDGEVEIYTESPQETLVALLDMARRGDLSFKYLNVKQGNLEDVFLNLTGRRLRG